jgi:hypothetical protein
MKTEMERLKIQLSQATGKNKKLEKVVEENSRVRLS